MQTNRSVAIPSYISLPLLPFSPGVPHPEQVATDADDTVEQHGETPDDEDAGHGTSFRSTDLTAFIALTVA